MSHSYDAANEVFFKRLMRTKYTNLSVYSSLLLF
jgi:hypothetical protein